tara:strand:- start:29 stop:757 length:729 start_codon:yes stop_codon:yes gene_type:complete
MSINPGKWVGTLPNHQTETNIENYNLDSSKWTDTIPKRKVDNPIKKYSVTAILFIVGLIFVSLIKNETRNLQKEINDLQASINGIRLDLHQATLDYEVITSPENLKNLADQYLENDLVSYKKSQIKSLNPGTAIFIENAEAKNKKNIKNKTQELTGKMKTKVAQEIKKKKVELKKLQAMYSKPENLPKEVKTRVSNKIEKTKEDLRKLYSDPKSVVKSGKTERWVAVQVVKAFLGIPVIPGR